MTYSTRYQAEKAKRTDPYISGDAIIVKVCGGYKIMTPEEYRAWRKQK